jgi:hypothetical protein
VRVEWAFACRTLLVDGSTAAVDGVDSDSIEGQLPRQIGLPILARLAAAEVDCGTDFAFECHLTGPELEQIETRLFSVTVHPPGPSHPEGWEVKTFFPTMLLFDAKRPGTYAFDFWIDGRFRWQVPFRVLAA